MKSLLLWSLMVSYAVVALARVFLPGRISWLIGLIAFHLMAGCVLRFLTNARSFAACAALGALSAEALVFRSVASGSLAIATGTLLELLPALYFTRQFFLTMGE